MQIIPNPISKHQLRLLPPEKQKDKDFVIIIPMHNHANICEKTLRSIANQTYQNYRVVCIDDGSTIPAKQNILNFVESIDDGSRFHYIEYQKHSGSVERVFEIVQQSQDDEVIVYFEGNSWLSENTTLEKLNELYKQYDVWLAYGQVKNSRTKEISQHKLISSENMFSSSMRRRYWPFLRFKSFYAGLFKKIKIEDFFFRGKFVDDRFDQAYMFPMLEMAGSHVACLPDVCLTYVQDSSFTIIDRPCSRSPRKCYRKIISTQPYNKLSDLFYDAPSNDDTDLIIFSYDRPMQLHALLDSIDRHMTGFHNIFVIYKTSAYKYTKGFYQLKKQYPKIQFIRQTPQVNDFKPLLMQVLKKASPYIIFSVDDMVVKDNVDLKTAIKFLDITQAYCFSLRLGEHINYCYMGDFPSEVPNHVYVNPSILAWEINSARGDWTYANSLDMTIYRRDQILKDFNKITFRNPNQLEVRWNSIMPKEIMRKVIGLCFKESKALNIPLNQVNISKNRHANLLDKKELLNKYLDGERFDLSPLFQMKNESVHIEYQPIFTQEKHYQEERAGR